MAPGCTTGCWYFGCAAAKRLAARPVDASKGRGSERSVGRVALVGRGLGRSSSAARAFLARMKCAWSSFSISKDFCLLNSA